MRRPISITTEDLFDDLLSGINAQFREATGHDFSAYADDPAGFITDVLGETLTPDLIEICKSVAEHPITIAQSGNGTGKSWISARLALWFFLCRTEPQVYCAAAPPQTNLENILWAEIADICNSHGNLVSNYTEKHLRLTRSPLEFIAGVAIPSSGNDAQRQAKFAGKHARSLMFLIDEGDAVPDAVFAGIETCLSGGYTKM
jgi:hypothetical protein